MDDANEEELKQLREKMNLVVSTNSAQNFNYYYLKRYLRAFKSVHTALKAILKTNKWRAEYGVEDIQKNKKILKKYSDKAQVLIHRDIVGRPIVYIPTKNHSSTNNNIDDLTKKIVYCLEEACKKCFEKVIDNLCIVFDLNMFNFSCINYPLLKNLLWLLDKHYPERLGVCLIIKAPKLFSDCWTVIKGCISIGHNPDNQVIMKENIGLEKIDGDPHTKHYKIKTSPHGEFYLAEKHSCSIPELINYHRDNTGGLCSRSNITPLSYMSTEIWEIDPIQLVLMEELGACQFSVVKRGVWRENIDVAVKVMKKGAMAEEDFIKEDKVMRSCWKRTPEERPSFSTIEKQLEFIASSVYSVTSATAAPDVAPESPYLL